MPTRLLFLLLLASMLLPVGTAPAQSVTTRFDWLLTKYVLPGGVRYADWNAHPEDASTLTEIAELFAQNDPGTTNQAERLAFYVNAYNSAVLRGVVDRYPIRSVRDLAPRLGFFSRKTTMAAGALVSLDAIERDILIKESGDPRFHFVLSRASRGSPALRPLAYRGTTLERDLNLAVVAFLNGPHGVVRVADRGQTVVVSELFQWFRADFDKGGGVIAFLNRYRDTKLPANAKVSYARFDWTLNDAR